MRKKRISSLYSEISSTTQTPQLHSWADLGASLFSELRGLVMGKDHWGRIRKGGDVIKHLHKLWYNLTPWSYQLIQWPRDGVISQPECLSVHHPLHHKRTAVIKDSYNYQTCHHQNSSTYETSVTIFHPYEPPQCWWTHSETMWYNCIWEARNSQKMFSWRMN